MPYAIICKARKGHNLGVSILGLVDRAKSKRLWWTSDDPCLLICYRKHSAAQFAAGRLRMNAARVVPLDEATRLLASQAKHIRYAMSEIDHQDALMASEDGWDGHKHG